MRSINDWYLNYEQSDGGRSADDDRPDRGPNAWLDRAAYSAAKRGGVQGGRPSSSRRRRARPETITPWRARRDDDYKALLLSDLIQLLASTNAEPDARSIAIELRRDGWRDLRDADVARALETLTRMRRPVPTRRQPANPARTRQAKPAQRAKPPRQTGKRIVLDDNHGRGVLLHAHHERAADICPACGVKVSQLGTCRCSR